MRSELLDRLSKGAVADNDELTVENALVSRDDAPSVPIRIYRPVHATGLLPVLLDIHGGGFVMGSVGMNDALNRQLASKLSCVVISVEYRLAPETRAPGAVEDCYAVLLWIGKEAEAQSFDLSRLGVIGRSAGGGIAACLALLARDRGEIPISIQVLLWPALDDRTCVTAAPDDLLGEFYWTIEDNRFGWSSLLGSEPGSENISCYAAAARAPSLAGLPPTYIAAPGLDLLVRENIDYARRLIGDGVPTELHIYPGAFHGFSRVVPTARVSRACERDILDALRRAFESTTREVSSS